VNQKEQKSIGQYDLFGAGAGETVSITGAEITISRWRMGQGNFVEL